MAKERPLLMKGPLIVKTIKGLKTQTRRIIRPEWSRCLDLDDPDDRAKAIAQNPYGQPGDRLYVRETFATRREPQDIHQMRQIELKYLADGATSLFTAAQVRYRTDDWKVRPGIHMPKIYSRLYLKILEVRIERIQDISWADIRAEGKSCPEHDFHSGFCTGECSALRKVFKDSWNRINNPRGYHWIDNDFVFVVCYEVDECFCSA